MAYAIGTVTGDGTALAHQKMLTVFRSLCESVGWVVLRHNTSAENHELIMRAPGLSGTEEIFVGVRTYQSVTGDYYNLLLGVFTGYVPENTFDGQPGAGLCGIPAHNNSIDYFTTANGQRLVFMLKVGTPVYMHGYAGKLMPYARPSEYPYPVACAGILLGPVGTRFSDGNNYFPYHGRGVSSNAHFYVRRPDGVWIAPALWPFSHGNNAANGYALAGPTVCEVPANGIYQLEPIIAHALTDTISLDNNIWGELDGVYFVSGFNNTVENVVQVGGSTQIDQGGMSVAEAVAAIKAVGGRAFVVGQNVNRTGWRDYVAIEME